ncbi:hypothetical protein SESBI_44977 [Sesbania bispinosa]|nr:hypothetical protein SESBI_44977 [Sesbania bispinosa]
MDQTAKPKALIVLLLFIFIFNHTWLVHSRNLATSPSPAPVSAYFLSKPLQHMKEGKQIQEGGPFQLHAIQSATNAALVCQLRYQSEQWQWKRISTIP